MTSLKLNQLTMMTQVDRDVYTPLIIAAGGGGRGYSSQSGTQLEQMDYEPSQPGRNGRSNAAGTIHKLLNCLCLNLFLCWSVVSCACLWSAVL